MTNNEKMPTALPDDDSYLDFDDISWEIEADSEQALKQELARELGLKELDLDTNTEPDVGILPNAKTNQPNDETYAHNGVAIIGVWLFLMIGFVLGIWIMQKSVNAYYMQTYHKESPMAHIDNVIWKLGGQIGDWLYAKHGQIADGVGAFNQRHIDNYNLHYGQKNNETNVQTTNNHDAPTQTFQGATLAMGQEPSFTVETPVLDEKTLLKNSLTLNKNQKVFFAGDSMMQGIAPHIQKYLQGLDIKSINLSKQSTGLTYSKFFDWNKTIKKTINGDNDIKVLIVMLGANDPWNINTKEGKHLKFKSQEWDSEYQRRMADIIDFAKSKNVGVIWVTPPNMKKSELNEQMNHLNDVMTTELKRHTVQMIDSRPIMGGKNNRYQDYLNKDGKQIKMRTSDGIHFTPEGQRILAKEVQAYLVIE